MAVSKVEEWATKSALSKELVPLARDSFDHVVLLPFPFPFILSL